MSPRSALLAVLLLAAAAPGTAHAVASAELYRNQAERYGRFEARIRYGAGDGIISSFFLWKVGSEVSGTYWNELDFEKLGANCRMQTNTLYGNPLMGAEQSHTMPSDMCEAYHDYAFEWTPDAIVWFIDSREIRRVTGDVARAFAENTPEGMRVHFNIWPGNANFGGNFSEASLPVRQYISWVQFSSYENGRFNLKWREEFDGAGVPSGWATGNWQSPLMLSTHDTRNVTFRDGIAILSLTSDNGTGFTGAPPKDDGGAAGTAGAAGSGGRPSGGAPNAGGQPQSTGGVPNAGGQAQSTGGAPSAGGRPPTSGGAAGSAGMPSVGAAGALSGSAGTSNAGANNAGASNAGANNAVAGAGGAANPANGGGGTVATSGRNSTGGLAVAGMSGSSPGPDEADGCGCRSVVTHREPLGAAGAALLLALSSFIRRRANASRRR